MDTDVLRIWWVVAAMLVLLMQLGFICLEMGCVREHSRPGIAVKNFVMLLVSSVVFSLIGANLMFGPDVGGFIGIGPAQLELDSTGWLFFQTGFAAVAATILSGALAGRTTLFSNVALAFVMALFIYPIFGHWVWGGGWLQKLGARDFAGSGAVHFLGGMTALVAARIAGPRQGFLDEENRVQDLGPRNLPFATIAVVLLWVGWIGFNGGSVLESHLQISGVEAIGKAVLATCCAASGGGMCAIVVGAAYAWKLGRGKGLPLDEAFRQKLLFDPWGSLGGTMGGMVAITANCDWIFMEHIDTFLWIAVGIGIVGGIAAFFAALFVREVLEVDDPVEAVAVHAGAGAAGVLLAGFAKEGGGGFLVQVLFLVSATVWVLVIAVPVLLLLRKMELLRASMAEEELGLTFMPYEAAVVTREMLENASSPTSSTSGTKRRARSAK